jgi:hypothetical protein
MSILRLKPFCVPRRYVFSDPDTHRLHVGTTRDALKAIIQAYRSQNELEPIENLDLVLENYWCSLPENTPVCEPAPLRRGFMSFFKGGVALISDLFFGTQNLVSQAEADRRAEICTRCPHNVFPDKLGFIAWSDEIALHSTNGLKSSHHDLLGNCGVCSCPLRAKVFRKGPFRLSPAERTEMAEVGCWQPLAADETEPPSQYVAAATLDTTPVTETLSLRQARRLERIANSTRNKIHQKQLKARKDGQ